VKPGRFTNVLIPWEILLIEFLASNRSSPGYERNGAKVHRNRGFVL